MCLDAKRDVVMPHFFVQFADGAVVEVVVVVMREEDGIERRQVGGQGRVALREWFAAEEQGSGAVENGVGDKALARHLEEHGGMAKPDEATIFEFIRAQWFAWQRRGRILAFRRGEVAEEPGKGGVIFAVRRDELGRFEVLEEGAVVVLGSPDFGEAGRIRFAAEGWVEIDIGGDGKRQQHGEDEEPFQGFQGEEQEVHEDSVGKGRQSPVRSGQQFEVGRTKGFAQERCRGGFNPGICSLRGC